MANGTAERDAALIMLEKLPGTTPLTVAGDKGFDTFGFVAECRNLRVVPHLAQNTQRPGGSAILAKQSNHGPKTRVIRSPRLPYFTYFSKIEFSVGTVESPCADDVIGLEFRDEQLELCGSMLPRFAKYPGQRRL